MVKSQVFLSESHPELDTHKAHSRWNASRPSSCAKSQRLGAVWFGPQNALWNLRFCLRIIIRWDDFHLPYLKTLRTPRVSSHLQVQGTTTGYHSSGLCSSTRITEGLRPTWPRQPRFLRNKSWKTRKKILGNPTILELGTAAGSDSKGVPMRKNCKPRILVRERLHVPLQQATGYWELVIWYVYVSAFIPHFVGFCRSPHF